MPKYIDADAHAAFLTEQALKWDSEDFVSRSMNTSYRLAIGALDAAPAADVAPVAHGEWRYYSGEFVTSHFRCSCCNTPRYEHYACNQFRYCPNCGAKMDGGAE